MTQELIAPYGSWKSPITADAIIAETVGIVAPKVDGSDIYWIETRPFEGGRNVIVRLTPDGQTTDITPPPFNARARVHEYGGGSYVVDNGTVYFSNFLDQRLYWVTPGAEPQAITPEVQLRYADGVIDHQRNRMICVREDHTVEGPPCSTANAERSHESGVAVLDTRREAVNTLASVALTGAINRPLQGDNASLIPTGNAAFASSFTQPVGDASLIPTGIAAFASSFTQPVGGTVGQVLVAGNDFYSTPRLSPDGTRLAWLTWNHPNMPWDGTELWVAQVAPDGTLTQSERVAGGLEESIFQPAWSPDNTLYFVSDRTNWWNLYRWSDSEKRAIPLHEMEAEFGMPQWGLDMSTYTFASSELILCTYLQQGDSHLAKLNTTTGELVEIETPYSTMSSPQALAGHVVFMGGSPTAAGAIVKLNLESEQIEVLRTSSSLSIDAGYLSTPEQIEFPTEHDLTAYAFYYPPRNQDYIAPTGDSYPARQRRSRVYLRSAVLQGELPPLLVMSHGGPTANTVSILNMRIQYWTSRGIAVLDVNYGGSTGFGRAYRERLAGQWGIVDVDDCVNGAKYLVQQGLVDGNRLMIDGGSAGGYTTLCALTFRDTFKAGASYFGVSDIEALVRDTHKFETRYTFKLVGLYPERRDIYLERSPINYVERISCPIIFFQGLEDKVVPPNQAELMVEAMRTKGLPVAYVPFEGEQHGFRRAENIKRSIEGELYFYSRVFGFNLAEPIEPVTIENL